MLVLDFKRLTENATLPTRGSDFAVGMDLYAAHDAMLHYGQVTKVGTGLAVALPSGHYGRVAARSGLAAKHGVAVLAGVVDEDYRGELVVLLTLLAKTGLDPIFIAKGDRIAQLILERATIPHHIRFVDALSDTQRGSAGYGSTGK